MEDTPVRILQSGGIPGSGSGVVGCDLYEDELASYTEDNDAHDWDFANVPIDSHVDVRASLRWDFDAICELSCSANATVLKDANGVLRLAL